MSFRIFQKILPKTGITIVPIPELTSSNLQLKMKLNSNHFYTSYCVNKKNSQNTQCTFFQHKKKKVFPKIICSSFIMFYKE